MLYASSQSHTRVFHFGIGYTTFQEDQDKKVWAYEHIQSTKGKKTNVYVCGFVLATG